MLGFILDMISMWKKNVPVSLFQANFVMKSQIYEEELNKLRVKNVEIMEELTNQISASNELQSSWWNERRTKTK